MVVPGPEQVEFDLILIVSTYLLAILSRFKVLILLIHTVMFLVKIYQLIFRHRVQIDEKMGIYIHNLRIAEKTIFPVVFGPIVRIFKKSGPPKTTEKIDSITVKKRYVIPDYK